MFERFKRAIAGQKAGQDAFKKILLVAGLKCAPICREIEQETGCALDANDVAVSLLLSVYFFDYLVQNVVEREVSSAYHLTDKRDLEMFLRGADQEMRSCPSFGKIGIKLQDSFLERCSEAKNRATGVITGDTYAELIGSWFLEALELNPTPDTAIIVGNILRNHARHSFT